MATLSVYFEQRRVGTIDIDKNGPGFTYDPGWVGLKGAFPISITMPLDRSELLPTLSCRGQQTSFQRACN
jgi:HipA N-terminal domain